MSSTSAVAVDHTSSGTVAIVEVEKPIMIYKTHAKSKYQLSDEDLKCATLTVKTRCNPHDSRYTSTLYIRSEIAALAESLKYRRTDENIQQMKAEDENIQQMKAEKERRAAEEKQFKKEAKSTQSELDKIALQAAAFTLPPTSRPNQMLPTVIWIEILSFIANAVDVDSIDASMSVVARKIVRFCSLSKELYEILPYALNMLGDIALQRPASKLLKSLPAFPASVQQQQQLTSWSSVLVDGQYSIRGAKLPVLRKLCKALGLVAGVSSLSVASLTVLIFKQFGVHNRSTVHPFVLWCLRQEKTISGYRHPDAVIVCQFLQVPHEAPNSLGLQNVDYSCLFLLYKTLVEVYGIRAAFDKLRRRQRASASKANKKKCTAAAAAAAGQTRRCAGLECQNIPSPTCVMQCCKVCCVGNGCPRHQQ